jgi:biotin operon repressor
LPPSEKQPEALTQSTFEILQELEIKAEAEPDALSPSLKDAATFDLRNNIDRTLFFGFYNEVADALLPTLDVSCQVLYNRLFRLSYGFNRNYCTVSQPILMEKTGLSRNTVRTGLQSLTKAGWIQIVESGNRISTTYRIVLPREQSEYTTIRLPKFDPQNLTLKI